MTATAAPGTASRAGGGPPREHAVLDMLRFGAALFIVLFHYGANAPTPLRELAPIFGRGWIATDFFLLLSGYVLGRAYGGALDHGRLRAGVFLRRRVLRLWPAHLVVLVGFAAVLGLAGWVGMAANHPEAYSLDGFLLQAGMLHGVFGDGQPGWNTPTWTLSALILCYLLFPPLWRASRPLHGRPAALWAAAGVIGAASAFSLLVVGGPLVDTGWGPLRAVPLFAAGALLARFAPALRLRGAPWVAALAVVAIVAAQTQPRSLLTDLEVLGGEAVLILAADAWAVAGFALAGYLGQIAFSLFLVHEPVSALWFHAVAAEVQQLGLSGSVQWLLWSLSPAVAVAAAAAFHAAVDAPLQRLLRDRPPAAACPVAAPGAL